MPNSSAARAEVAARRLRPALLALLRSRYRALASEHEDLVQQALSDVYRYFSKRGVWPDDDADVDRLAFTILRRRVADKARSAASHVDFVSSDDLEEAPDLAPPLESVVRYRRFLELVMQELDRLNDADRDTLVDETLGRGDDAAKAPSERQRLSRARARLRNAVETRIGMKIKNFLGG